MGTICLSNAPILRCQTLTRIELGILQIPAGLEFIFSVSLLFAKKGTDKRHYLLSADGMIYFLLTLVDFLAHIIPSIRDSFTVFKGLDIFLGSVSFIPLVLFATYLYFLTTQDVLPGFPRRLQVVTKYFLLILIPLIAIANQLASFIGISYHLFRQRNRPSTVIIGIQFNNDTIRYFLNALTLVLLVVFQALNFFTAFLRLVKAFINQRRIDSTANGGDNEVHLFNGLGWICAGIKLGAVESLIGFVQGGFGESLTRRILRMLGRACLIIGVVKGMDVVEDFQFLKAPSPKPKRRSALRALISNPRYSTFQQLGGQGVRGASPIPQPEPNSIAQIINAATAPVSIAQPSHSPLTSPPNVNLPAQPKPTFSMTQRVVVRRVMNRAPTLELRPISDLDIPSPPRSSRSSLSSASSQGRQGDSHALIARRQTSPYPLVASPVSMDDADIAGLPLSTPPESSVLASSNRLTPGVRYTIAGSPEYTGASIARKSSLLLPHESYMSNYSAASDPLDAVRSLAGQFPGIPSRPVAPSRSRPITLTSPAEGDEDNMRAIKGMLSRSVSDRSGRSQVSQGSGSLVRRSSSVRRKPVPKDIPSDADEASSFTLTSAPVSRSNSYKSERVDDVPPLPVPVPFPPTSKIPDSPLSGDSRQYTGPPARSAILMYNRTVARPEPVTSSTLEFPWVERTSEDIGVQGEIELEKARRSLGIARIKSVGHAPRRTTPPVQSARASFRESIVATLYDIPAAVGRKRLKSSDLNSLVAEVVPASPTVMRQRADSRGAASFFERSQ
ncbi:hypothetical protein K474DRAFT_1518135 [Panus rudis PR-1116 ss-1]|nr:hypothetical protein K474DRAFT_1518135 [Panus rudis PR-1116 ss-1]